jgi:hypothetical protein
MGQIERTSPCLQTPATKTPTGFIKLTQHKPPKDLTFLHLEFPLKCTDSWTKLLKQNIVRSQVSPNTQIFCMALTLNIELMLLNKTIENVAYSLLLSNEKRFFRNVGSARNLRHHHPRTEL